MRASISCLCGGLLFEASCFDELPVWYDTRCPDCGKRQARVMDPNAKPTPDWYDGMGRGGFGPLDEVVEVSRSVQGQYTHPDVRHKLTSPSAQEGRAA